jgi:serine phosphatase RsbU (regulator of sigma subunit)/outer membrane biosynthesis protein TonB
MKNLPFLFVFLLFLCASLSLAAQPSPVKVKVLDENGKPLKGAMVWINDSDVYISNPDGTLSILLVGGEKPTKVSATKGSLELKKWDYNEKNKALKIILGEKTPEPVAKKEPEPKPQPKPAPEPKKVEPVVKVEEKDTVDIFKADFDKIINSLDYEKQVLAQESEKIKAEMQLISEKMNSQNLSPAQQQALSKQMSRLESALIDNEKQFQQAQAQTHEIFKKLQAVMIERDSIAVVAKQALDDVQSERTQSKQNLLIFSVIAAGLLILLAIAFFIARQFRQKNVVIGKAYREIELKNSELNKQREEIAAKAESLRQANELISASHAELEKKNLEINRKNQKILASIQYASRMQTALLPDIQRIRGAIPEFFVLLKPRDMVSGDFYWFEEVQGKTVLTAVDCTGHGVPGAIMSMVGMEQLEEIVKIHGITDPAEILKRLDKSIRTIMKQEQNKTRDGMDMALCVIDTDKQEVKFAGAKNPIVYVQKDEKGEQQLHLIKADKFPIGGWEADSDKLFTEHRIALQKQKTTFYLFSDGFEDQFGGNENRKFMSKNMRNLLFEIHEKSMDEQRRILDSTITNWQGSREQTDDILVIGFRI